MIHTRQFVIDGLEDTIDKRSSEKFLENIKTSGRHLTAVHDCMLCKSVDCDGCFHYQIIGRCTQIQSSNYFDNSTRIKALAEAREYLLVMSDESYDRMWSDLKNYLNDSNSDVIHLKSILNPPNLNQR